MIQHLRKLANIISQTLVAVVLKTEEANGEIVLTTSPSNPMTLYNLKNESAKFDFASSCGLNNCPATQLPPSYSKTTPTSFAIFYALLVTIGTSSIVVTIIFIDNLSEDDCSGIKEKNENTIGEIEMKSEDLKSKRQEKLTLKLLSTTHFFNINIVISNFFKISLTKTENKFKTELISVLKVHLKPEIWLIMSLMIYTFFEQTFIWFEFNRAFATCLLGVNYVGWTNVFQGVLSSIFSLLTGVAVKHVGLKVGIVFMLLVSAAINIFILSWTPDPEQVFVVFLLSAGYAMSQSIAKSQVTGLYGIHFPNNPVAYSAFAMTVPSGYLLGSLVSSYACVKVKSYIHLGLILLSFICFFILEVRRDKRLKDAVSQNDENIIM
jgi:hypothetical protein